MSWRPGRSRSFRRSEDNLDSGNAEEAAAPTSSRTGFLRIKTSSGPDSNQSVSRGSSFRTGSGPQPFSLGNSFSRLSSRSNSNSSSEPDKPSIERNTPLRTSLGSDSSLRSSTLPWSFNREPRAPATPSSPPTSCSYENSSNCSLLRQGAGAAGVLPFSSSSSATLPRRQDEEANRMQLRNSCRPDSWLRPEEHSKRLSQSPSLLPASGQQQQQQQLSPNSHEGSASPRPSDSSAVSRTSSNASSVSSSMSISSAGSSRGNTSTSTRRRLQRVELLQLTEPLRELIHPSSVVVSQGEVYIAEAVTSPIERLRRKDEEIVRALEDKQRLIEDILRLPSASSYRILEEGDSSSASSLSAGSSSALGCSAGEILITALTQAKNLTNLINKSLKVTDDDLMREMTSNRSGSRENQERQQIIGRTERLVQIANSINRQLTTLLVALQDTDKERDVLRREVARSQDQVRSLMGGGSGVGSVPEPSWSSPLSPLSPLPSPFTSKSSSPPLSDTGDRLSALSLLSR